MPAASRRRGPSKNKTLALSCATTTASSSRMSILRMRGPHHCLTRPADANVPLAIPDRHGISKLRPAASGW